MKMLSEFERVIVTRDDPTRTCFVLLMCWLAQCDGHLGDNERELLRKVTYSGGSPIQLDELLRITQHATSDDIQLALEVLRDATSSSRKPMLQLVISLALVDGHLLAIENHIVRLVADVLGLGLDGLHDAFREMTGRDFPEPEDLSDPAFWERRQTGSSRSTRQLDLATLGLDGNPSADDIRAAFRRLAKVHHPDRFASAGPEAVKTAELQFKRIRSAYERLVGA
jgi:DnaJ-domain-containing protein 1